MLSVKELQRTFSDFPTNLIKHYLCSYTETFTLENMDESLRRQFTVPRAVFNYKTKVLDAAQYTLPELNGDFVC